VEGANEPLFSLHWILGIYAAHLPPGERERFLDLPIRELEPADSGELSVGCQAKLFHRTCG